MTTLIILLSLLATDCRVHRNPYTQDSTVSVGCIIDGKYTIGTLMGYYQLVCAVDSHYIDTCAVKKRCDTVWYYKERWAGFWYVNDSIPDIHCYPDTAESDEKGCKPTLQPSGVVLLDSAELSDIREMPKRLKALELILKQIQRDIAFRTCLDTLNIRRRYYWRNLSDTSYVSDTLPHRTVRDSCRCLYERKDVR